MWRDRFSASDNLSDTIVTAPFTGTLSMDDVNIGDMTTNLSGKLSVSAEAEAGKEIEIKVVRK